jgi:hypothetical protein
MVAPVPQIMNGSLYTNYCVLHRCFCIVSSVYLVKVHVFIQCLCLIGSGLTFHIASASSWLWSTAKPWKPTTRYQDKWS